VGRVVAETVQLERRMKAVRPTIADIARRAGVSKGAVSYALNGRPGVSELTRQRILRIAEEVGWKPSSAARALSGVRVGAVGLAVSRPARVLGLEPFFMQLISGIEAELSAHDTALMLQVVADHQAESDTHRRWWAERRVDGVILVDLRVDDRRVHVLAELGMPAVVIGGPSTDRQVIEVWSDDHEPMATLVGYLAALGHRRIAHVTGPSRLLHVQMRSQACRDTAARLGLEEPLTLEVDYTGELAARATRTLLSASPRPTAIIYDNDVMAVAGVSVAQEMGVAVPRDMSIVAWEDSPLCELVHPPLTALHRDVMAYGSHAARRLLDFLGGAPDGAFQDATSHLIPRGSTSRPLEPAPPAAGVAATP
jgi:DNA-binding LacI/PurR family transcriptional regulator